MIDDYNDEEIENDEEYEDDEEYDDFDDFDGVEEFLDDLELPVLVEDEEDAVALAKTFHSNVFGHRRRFREIVPLINKDENMYFLSLSTISVRGIMDDAQGIVFFSDERFVARSNDGTVFEIAIDEIQSVGASDGAFRDKVSFRTAKDRVDFLTKSCGDQVSQLLLYLACDVDEDDSEGKKVVECPGCGASVLVSAGGINQCDYCQRHVG